MDGIAPAAAYGLGLLSALLLFAGIVSITDVNQVMRALDLASTA